MLQQGGTLVPSMLTASWSKEQNYSTKPSWLLFSLILCLFVLMIHHSAAVLDFEGRQSDTYMTQFEGLLKLEEQNEKKDGSSHRKRMRPKIVWFHVEFFFRWRDSQGTTILTEIAPKPSFSEFSCKL